MRSATLAASEAPEVLSTFKPPTTSCVRKMIASTGTTNESTTTATSCCQVLMKLECS